MITLSNYQSLFNTTSGLNLLSLNYCSYAQISLWNSIIPASLHPQFSTYVSGSFYIISKSDIFNEISKPNPNINVIYFLIFMWGYPSASRGTKQLILNTMNSFINIHHSLSSYASQSIRNIWLDCQKKLNLGRVSTFSKFLYFINLSNSNQVRLLILDDVLVNIFNNGKILEVNNYFQSVLGNNYKFTLNSGQKYEDYCVMMNLMAQNLGTTSEILEYFIYNIVRNQK